MLSVLLFSCAQVASPSGGSVDRKPPKVVRYKPDSAALNFNARSIEIQFDEYFQLQELNNQLIISPPLEVEPEITIKKKTLFIQFDKKEILKPNTTYSISFGNALKDIRENNAFENFSYIFSTGNFIDSLKLKGTVQFAFDHKTEKNLLVLLYATNEDSVIYKRLPDYFAKTNDAGFFQVNNIKPGKYKVVALKDANNNYKYEEEENIGFLDSMIEAGQSTDLLINMYPSPPKLFYLKKYMQPQYGKFLLVFNTGSDSIHISKFNAEKFNGVKELTTFSKNNDTLTYWLDHIDRDSLTLQIKNGATILDTVSFKLIKKTAALKSSREPLKLSLTASPDGKLFDLNKELALIFSHPVISVDAKQPLTFKEDSLSYTRYPLVLLQPEPNSSTIILTTSVKKAINNSGKNFLLKERSSYHLLIPPGTITDFLGFTNDSLKINFKTQEEKFYGTVKLNLKFPAIKGNYIVQLLDSKEQVIRENSISNPQLLFYDYLYPQVYKLKIIADVNGNGKWDAGNYLKKQQPEKVFYNVESVNIRSNWDLDLEWKIIEPH